ncbi:hypothetical protein KIN20_006691 [Parelaphostrongylus tenuis]|uniref:Uncharacterized protein n=1 Tax=Parelaphostrongylus tenuis TaxID=148309 RepID=A0AAD5M250_PARTN|nr:hypothetical protein KIN20_006691 [Parelaphostrongylus tenuis]
MWSDADDDLFEDFADTVPLAPDGEEQNSNGVLDSNSVGRSSQMRELPSDTQRRDRVVVHYDHDDGEVIAPSNEFETILSLEDIEVRSDENYKKYVYIGNITSDALVAKLETKMSDQRYKEELLFAFEEALKVQGNLVIYLEPSHSSCGIQESIIRVLLLCRSSQVKTFELLMNQLQILQKEGQNKSSICHLCIAQIRFIDRIYYSHTLFCSIFERDIQHWSPEIRNALILSIPEVITDVSVQIGAVKELQSLLLSDVETDPVGCKLAVISALSLLNSEPEASKKMQERVLNSLSAFDLELLPSLIELFLRRLNGSTKDAFCDLLGQLSTHLHVDQLSLSRRGKLYDEIVGEIFGKITQFVVLGGECRWREVYKFFKSGGLSEKHGAIEIVSQESIIAPNSGSSRELGSFDVILSIALLSLRTCPPSVANAIKLTFAQTNEDIEDLSRLFGNALKLKRFCELNVSSIISIAQHCLWSTKQNAQQFGAKLFKELFLSLPKRRELVLKTMLSHAVYSEGESEAVLNQFTLLIDENAEAVEPFSEVISEYFFILHRMTTDNVKRFFRAVFRLYAKRPSLATEKNNLNAMIPILLRSADNVQPIFGVLASLVKLESTLLLEGPSTREEEVRESMHQLDEIRTSYPHVKPFFYSELASILSDCLGCSKCQAMNEWLTVFIEEFRSDFFTDRYEATRELEGERYICTESNYG